MPYFEIRRTIRYSVDAATDNEAVALVSALPTPINPAKGVQIIAALEPEVYDSFDPGENVSEGDGECKSTECSAGDHQYCPDVHANCCDCNCHGSY